MESSRREALGVAAVWIIACVWVVGYAFLNAYKVEATPTLVLGMPAWVFWGVIAPWFVVLAVTVWAAFWGIRDEDLGEDHADDELPHGLDDLQHKGEA
jgi:hypothetical protein